MLYSGKSLVAVDHNLSQGARLSLLFTSILSLFTFYFKHQIQSSKREETGNMNKLR